MRGERARSRFFKIALAALLLVTGGCATTQPPRLYMLSPLSEQSEPASRVEQPVTLAIGVGPVRFPEYLERKAIIRQGSGGRISAATAHRWAEPLKESFSRVLAENLSLLLGTDRIALYPWRSWQTVDYQVAVDVIRFDAGIDGDVWLVAQWAIREHGSERPLLEKRSRIRLPLTAADYSAIVVAHDRVLEQLSRTIADAIIQLQRPGDSAE